MADAKELRPNPDPSSLTTDQILRENAWLKELLHERITGKFDAIAETLKGMDKALVLLQTRADRVPSETDIAVNNLKLLHDEKFQGIANQFIERDTRTDQRAGDTKLAVDAAFAAADKAAGKSEAGFVKLIDALAENVETKAKNADDKNSDLKDRVAALENTKKGEGNTWAVVATVVGIAVAIVVPLVVVLVTRGGIH